MSAPNPEVPSPEATEAAQKAMTDLVDCCHCPTPCIIHENDAPILARALDAFAAAAVKAERDACARIASAQSDNYEKHRQTSWC